MESRGVGQPGVSRRSLAGHPDIRGDLERKQDMAVVLPSEGNEAERDGRQEVLAPS